MEKYGVRTGHKPGSVKEAADTQKCPLCSSELVKHGSVVLCKTHGSLPFEPVKDED